MNDKPNRSVAIITGGASGLGKAITEKLAQEKKNKIYFTYLSSKKAAKKIEDLHSNTKSIRVDFTSKTSLNGFLTLLSTLQLDVLINNAITSLIVNHFQKINPCKFQESFNKNIVPIISITQTFIKNARIKQFGKIITILSDNIINKPPIGLSEYTANKAYLHSLCKSWAVENLKFNITSNCLSPSIMQTNLIYNIDPRFIEKLIKNSPSKSLLEKKDVAEAVFFLVYAPQQINGINIIINSATNIL